MSVAGVTAITGAAVDGLRAHLGNVPDTDFATILLGVAVGEYLRAFGNSDDTVAKVTDMIVRVSGRNRSGAPTGASA